LKQNGNIFETKKGGPRLFNRRFRPKLLVSENNKKRLTKRNNG
jgi:hypothetical protein